jgi:cytochrome c biogenesis protein CcmG/thiol:disulfide interchange protein DsbE
VRRRRLLALAGVAAAAAVLVGILVVTADGGATRAPSVAPLDRLGGGAPVSLPSGQGSGRPTAVTFFASWCSPCRTELPVIARVASQEAASGVAVAFVGIDGNDDPAAGLAFARASGVAFPVGMDPASAVAPRFGLVGYPDTVFIDGKGEIAGIVRGPISEPTLRQWLQRLAAA